MRIGLTALIATYFLGWAAQAIAQPSSYQRAVEMYRAGSFEAATSAFAALSADDRLRGVREYIHANVKPLHREGLEAALALETEAAIVAGHAIQCADDRPGSRTLGERFDRGPLVRLIERTEADMDFLRSWYLLVIASNQIVGEIRATQGCLNSTPAMLRTHPEILLARGAIHETAWWLQHENGIRTLSIDPSLRAAEAAYRDALKQVPNFDEARLRLARVLTLQSDSDIGVEMLEKLQPQLEEGFSYLAHLFDGDALERRGEYDRALAAYRAAAALLPEAQSARMAAAHLLFLQGRRNESATDIRELTRETPAVDWTDPWYWYSRGTGWRTAAYLSIMRNIVRAKPATSSDR